MYVVKVIDPVHFNKKKEIVTKMQLYQGEI